MTRTSRDGVRGRTAFEPGDHEATAVEGKQFERATATNLARTGVALMTIYALGWLGLGFYVATGGVGGAVFFIVVAAICVGLAVLGLRHSLAAGALLLIPVTFPIGLASAALSDASGWAALAALLWFAVAPFLIGILFLVDACVGTRRRRRQRSAESETRPPLPQRTGGST
jgi:hypothetical protein